MKYVDIMPSDIKPLQFTYDVEHLIQVNENVEFI